MKKYEIENARINSLEIKYTDVLNRDWSVTVDAYNSKCRLKFPNGHVYTGTFNEKEEILRTLERNTLREVTRRRDKAMEEAEKYNNLLGKPHEDPPKDNCEMGEIPPSDAWRITTTIRKPFREWVATAEEGWWKLGLGPTKGGSCVRKAIVYVLGDYASSWFYTDISGRAITPFMVEDVVDRTIIEEHPVDSKEGEMIVIKTFCNAKNREKRWWPRAGSDVNFIHPKLTLLRQPVVGEEAAYGIVGLGFFNDGTRYWSKMNFETLMVNYYPDGSFLRSK
jgi:hypothetical protein